MSKDEWFRRTTWTDVDRQEFNARLNRCRGAWSKAQNLYLQALSLAEVGHQEGAIELLDRIFAEFPERTLLGQAHGTKADCLGKLGQTEAAINEYRAALQAERDLPNVKTNAWLDFGWYVVEKQLTDLYGEIQRVLKEFRDEACLKFPAIEYRYFAIQSLLADARGESDKAREFATQALAEASRDFSGLRYHPTVGLVGSERGVFDSRLRALAGS